MPMLMHSEWRMREMRRMQVRLLLLLFSRLRSLVCHSRRGGPRRRGRSFSFSSSFISRSRSRCGQS